MTTAPIYNFTDTWDNGATTFKALQVTVTDTGSAADSKLFDFIIGSDSKGSLDKDGNLSIDARLTANSATFSSRVIGDSYTVGSGQATGGGDYGLIFGSSDQFRIVPSNLAGSYDFSKELRFDPNGDAVWLAEGGFRATGTLTVTTGGADITGNIAVSGTVDGRDVASDGTKLDGIEVGADVTDEANVTTALGLISVGAHSDVDLTGILDGQPLIYNLANQTFEPGAEGSTLIGQAYTPSFTGAVERTIRNRLEQSASFLDFGAIGGGATSNRDAMDAVISSGIKSLFVPEGNYQWTADAGAVAFETPDAFSLVGGGLASRLTFDNSKVAHMFNFDGDSHCSIGAMRVNHASDGTYTGAHIIRATGGGLDGSLFSNLLLENSQNYAIGLQGGPITANIFTSILIDGTEDDGVDMKNTDDANEANVFSAMVVRNHSKSNAVTGKPAYDFRGPVIGSALATYGYGLNRSGSANSSIGLRMRTGELLDANGFGAHYSTVTGFYANAVDSTNTWGVVGNAYDTGLIGAVSRGANIGYEFKGPRQIIVGARAIAPSSDGFRTEDGGTAVLSGDDISLIGCNVTGSPTRGFSIEGDDNFLIGVRSQGATQDLKINPSATRTVVVGGQFLTIVDEGTDTTLLGIPTTKNNLVTTGGFEINQVGGDVLLDVTPTGSGVGGSAVSDIAWTVRKDGLNETAFRVVSDVGASNDRNISILTPLTDSVTDAFRIQTGNSLAVVVDATNAVLFDSTGKTVIKPSSTTDAASYDLHVKGSFGVAAGIGTTRSPENNGDWTLQIQSNTAVRIKVKGSDGVIRESANITLS